LTGFAANSILTRGALAPHLIDAPSFTLIRLGSGALMLSLLVRLRAGGPPAAHGTWRSGAALAGYAVAFTVAYTRIGAGIGALILFGAVQVTMIGTGLVRGERPRRSDWAGVVVAAAGLVLLTAPGAAAPDLSGAVLMAVAGACWGVYSLIGRLGRNPLPTTAGNFWRASILGALALGFLASPSSITATGALLATTSGALASGVAYTLWYAALPSLTAWRAALVQLSVPIMTALAATILLGEALTPRLLAATALVVFGVGLTIRPARQRP
jgi:drug/metabolite transporter (DMT)-like permease